MSWQDGLEHFVREGETLAHHTWLRMGGPAQFFAEPTHLDDLAILVRRCHAESVPVRLIGSGSNVLVSEEGVKGVVVHLGSGAFCGMRRLGDQLEVGAGSKLGHVVSLAAREGLAGLESLVGIPGTIGGAVKGNAGVAGSDIGQWTTSCVVLTRKGEIVERPHDELQFSYRQGIVEDLVIISARLDLEPSDPRELTKRTQRNWIVRRSKAPTIESCTASLFRDTAGQSAGSLIALAKLSDARVGDVALSNKDPNYVVVGRSGTSSEVRQLIDTIRKGVEDSLGVTLELQLEVW